MKDQKKKFKWDYKSLAYVLAWVLYLGFVGPALISAKSTELVLAGVVVGVVLVMSTFKFVWERFSE
jgi:hypothetical protein